MAESDDNRWPENALPWDEYLDWKKKQEMTPAEYEAYQRSINL